MDLELWIRSYVQWEEKKTKEPWGKPTVKDMEEEPGKEAGKKCISMKSGSLEIKGEVSFRKEGKVTRGKSYKEV